MDTERLKVWFKKERRDFPWRHSPTPYQVWISEVMLQQTQAAVVVDYFHQWMTVFPDIASLAEAPIEQVIKVWEGLGYYSRARNLHRAAMHLVTYQEGKLPDSLESLRQIPGIGPYTAGAILSFAYHKKAAAVDGNVIRVMARFLKIEEDIAKPIVLKRIHEAVEKLLPEEEPWIAMEALIELGARICKKSPECVLCPIKLGCQGREIATRLPFKEKKIKITELVRYVAVVFCQGSFLVRKGDSGKVMADLYEFPYWEEEIQLDSLGIQAHLVKMLSQQKMSFTRYRANLIPSFWHADLPQEIEGYQWMSLNQITHFPFSSGHRRILQEVLHAHFTH